MHGCLPMVDEGTWIIDGGLEKTGFRLGQEFRQELGRGRAELEMLVIVMDMSWNVK